MSNWIIDEESSSAVQNHTQLPSCPRCGCADEEQIDWRISDENLVVWECFECGHSWKTRQFL